MRISLKQRKIKFEPTHKRYVKYKDVNVSFSLPKCSKSFLFVNKFECLPYS